MWNIFLLQREAFLGASLPVDHSPLMRRGNKTTAAEMASEYAALKSRSGYQKLHIFAENDNAMAVDMAYNFRQDDDDEQLMREVGEDARKSSEEAVVQKTSFTPNFNNKTTSVADGYSINNNLITSLN
jgi:hypothetical protein